MSKEESGYDNITFFEIMYELMKSNQTSANNLMSILNATAPLFNNYSHYMPL